MSDPARPARSVLRRRFTWFAVALSALFAVSIAGGGFYVQRQLQRSLPLTTGSRAIAGLETGVTIDRDDLGIPTITAASRRDAALALGFLHAQDRFFQMDLQRRQPAGELSALVGARALPADRTARVHRFRHISREALAVATAEYRAILDAYARGVNAGLAALAAPPIEYHVLRAAPAPWQPEDTILTVLAMFNTLQGRQPQFEATFGTMHETLPPAVYAFLTAPGSEWDAPITGERFLRPGVPDASVFDLRSALPPAQAASSAAPLPVPSSAVLPPWGILADWSAEEIAGLGSNNWAVAGSHTSSGAAVVANDMHLGINVPNIWYRASIVVPDERTPAQPLRLTGTTLPGLPSLVTGSNGHVAWGFTNAGGDWSDLVIVEPDPRNVERYLTPDGPRPIDVFDEVIDVAGAPPESLPVRWTIWGPLIRQDHRGRQMAQRWVAHDPAILASDITRPERAITVDEALSAAAGLGMPGQNFVVGDAAGRIGWTIAGPIPHRVGLDGSRPTSWADGSRRWNGYLPAAAFPRVTEPPSGRIWTANSAVVGGEMLATIGEGGYADGIRARIIRDRLMAIDRATPEAMLSIQLDHSALFHDRWRSLLLQVLSRDDSHHTAPRAEFKRLVDSTWTGRADPESVAYRLVRTFRGAVSRLVYGPLNRYLRRHDPDFDYARANRAEGPLWQLVSKRPVHWLEAQHASWDALLLAAVDEAITELTVDGSALSAQTWGAFNRAAVTHPLGSSVPLIGPWLNMPADPLPGDIYTPRAHSPRAGPSQRMVVSPGREHEGIFHMPTGQSGHPLSPHYRDQHRAWVEGTPLPFLPGTPVSRLTLTPGSTR